MTWSPTVSLLGMRQVGKTTLIKSMVDDYHTFDDTGLVIKAQSSDWSFVDSPKGPLGLDECQKLPQLFDRIKLNVDKKKKPGQYLLSGSVRFLSKKQIRESLTGRTDIFELLPMNVSEAHSDALSDFLETSLNKDGDALLGCLEKQKRYGRHVIERAALTGGLPGICFNRDEKVRAAKFRIQTETLLSRDIDMIAPTQLGYAKLRLLLTELLKESGNPLNKARLAKKANLSIPTVTRILDAFEALFLVRKHGDTYFGADTGLTSFLINGWDLSSRTYLNSMLFCELNAQLSYAHRNGFSFESYTTRGGIDIPFVIWIGGASSIALAVDTGDGASDKSLIGLTWYKKRHRNAHTIVLHRGDRGYVSASGHVCIPYEWVF